MIEKLQLEKINIDEVKAFIKKEYTIDLDQDVDDVQTLKNNVFGKMYSDAKDLMSPGTVGGYRRAMNKCGNNRKKALNNNILRLGNSIIRKRKEQSNSLKLKKESKQENTMIKKKTEGYNPANEPESTVVQKYKDYIGMGGQSSAMKVAKELRMNETEVWNILKDYGYSPMTDTKYTVGESKQLTKTQIEGRKIVRIGRKPKFTREGKLITESRKSVVTAIYGTNGTGYTRELKLTPKNYKSYTKELDKIKEEFVAKNNGSDDFWLFDLWVDGVDVNIDWMDVLTNGSHIDEEKLNTFFKQEDAETFATKYQFLIDQGYDYSEDRLDEISVLHNASKDKDAGQGVFYDNDWLDEEFEMLFPALVKALEKANAYSYFQPEYIFRDAEWNGELYTSWIGQSFVWSWGL